jgi:hypothetical protein
MTEQAARIFHTADIIRVIFVLVGLIFALGIGLWPVRRDRLTAYAVAAGLLVNLPGCLEGGPELFAGLVLLPIVFVLAAHLGRGARWALVRTGIVGKKGEGSSHLAG